MGKNDIKQMKPGRHATLNEGHKADDVQRRQPLAQPIIKIRVQEAGRRAIRHEGHEAVFAQPLQPQPQPIMNSLVQEAGRHATLNEGHKAVAAQKRAFLPYLLRKIKHTLVGLDLCLYVM